MEKTKSISLILGVLIMSIFIVYLVFAWTEPPYGGTCTNPPCPPGGNVPAPLNVSLNAQSKEGALVIGTNSGLTTGLIVQYGKVGIGTTNPRGKLDVAGDVRGYILSSNTYPVGLEFNILFNGNNRYTVSQSGSTSFDLPTLFNGKLEPTYTPDGVNPSNPVIILIENLPNVHTQVGAWVEIGRAHV